MRFSLFQILKPKSSNRDTILQSAFAFIEQLAEPQCYVAASLSREMEIEAHRAITQYSFSVFDFLFARQIRLKLRAVRKFLKDPKGYRARANKLFVVNELIRSSEFFDTIESKRLTDEQRRAVVVDEDSNLLVAAAGSGKTSVIVAKAGWLIRRNYRRPSELLLLAFAKDAQKEMKQRVINRLGSNAGEEIFIRTFHSLGMSIIGDVEGKRPALAKVAEDDRALSDLLKHILGEMIQDRVFSTLLLYWFKSYFAPYRSITEFKNYGEYWNYIRANEIRSLMGEKLKSFEECEIANYLYLNGVRYEYERPYEHKTATSTKRQYMPDFFLPDFGIYIEHFGINETGNTAPFIDRDEYLRSIDWKRKIHIQYGTTLIETFSYERSAGKLTENLARKLAIRGVEMSPIPAEEVFAILEKQGRVNPFIRLIQTFLQHFKGAKLTMDEVKLKAASLPDLPRAKVFLEVFSKIFAMYQKHLSDLEQIDFHDMIVKATNHIERGSYKSPFRYILVDEFQDISAGRAGLLKALLQSAGDAKIFAVGDDWQSIYRFAGSDIAVMREFGKIFGPNERLEMGKTFRCNDNIALNAAKFVLMNPAQIEKTVSSTVRAAGPCVHIGFPSEERPDVLAEALNLIEGELSEAGETADVLLLGRYRHNQPRDIAALTKEHPNLRMKYMTVHGSKGLEADFVIVLGLSTGKHGFPTEMTDDPLLDIVLAKAEGYPNAEERRLFYVAITRAKRRVFLLTEGRQASPFVNELLKGNYIVTVFGRSPEADVACPKCIEGLLQRKEGKQGVFWGCSNWPYCDHIQEACPHCGSGIPLKSNGAWYCRQCNQSIQGCPRPSCGGWLQVKPGKYGQFLGCSHWPECNYTSAIDLAPGLIPD